MDALASIALAAARLDGVPDQRKPLNPGHSMPTNEPSIMVAAKATPLMVPTPGIPHLPPRQAFGNEKSLRVVSAENITPPPMSVPPSQENDEDVPSDPDSLEGLILLQTLDARSDDAPPPPPQTEVITSVKEDDVLCGRGGETNHHPGNIRYRGLVKKYQLLYLKAKRRDKPKIARLIVDTIRRRYGRFLKKDMASNTWRDVGNNKAREKTSQALREGAPELRNGQPPKNKNKKRKRENNARRNSGTMDQLSMAAAIVSPNPSSASFISAAPVEVTPRPNVVMPTTSSSDTDTDNEDLTMSPAGKKVRQVRGPRLKLLKARLVENESD